MHGIAADLRYGGRMLAKRPGTTVLAILALAMGIGLTTTMFSIVDGAILRGLPFDEGQRLMGIARVQATRPDESRDVPSDDFLDWRDRQQVFAEIAAFDTPPAVVSGPDGAERYRSARFTPNMLTLLRVSPARGRDFTSADAQPGAPRVMLISQRVWQNQFKSDPAVVGQVLRVNGQPTEVIGVMPAGFAFPETEDIWMPAPIAREAARGSGSQWAVIGRLKAGVSQAAATSALQTIAAQLAAEHIENKDFTVSVKPYVEQSIGRQVINTLFTMLGAVFGVLLIACANVTNLQLARALDRSRELAIRSALGGERLRIVRQLLVEGLLLSACGSLLGLGIAWIGITAFNAGIAGTNPPFWIDIRLDARVLFFVVATTVTAALLSSLLPAIRATRLGTNDLLKDQARGTTSLKVGFVTRGLVGFSVILSSALLIVSGLLIKSVVEVGRARYAFATSDVLVARTTIDEQKYPTDAAVLNLMDTLESRLRGVGGVRTVALATAEPLGGGRYYLTKEGQTFAKPEDAPTVRRIAATPAVFDVLRLAPIEGRAFATTDRPGSLPVAVVTRDFAQKYFAGEPVIGRRIRLGRDPKLPWWTIVGVVPRLLDAGHVDDMQIETVFVPLAQAPDRGLTVLEATDANPLAAAPGLRRALRDLDPDMPTFGINTLAGRLYEGAWAFRVFGSLFLAFGVAALVMASAGLYGVLAFGVRQRTSEIGVRMALGADAGRITRMILRQGMTVVGIGLALGVTLGGVMSPLMSALFFNVTPRDPIVFGLTIGILLATGLAASLIPARRAATVDPLVALRES